MALMAEFKTAYLQREVALDVKVAADVKVGQVCKLANDTITASTASSVAVGDVIIAQSDTTVGQGHIKIENRDHTYSDKVVASTDKKHVMVFVVSDPSDIIPKTV